MDDQTQTLNGLKELARTFCEERDWDQFHNIKDLSVALSIEASELLEIFRWKSEQEVDALFDKPVKVEAISDELSDILFFLVRIAQMHDIDLAESFGKKMAKNAMKYPAEKFRGSNLKYNEV